VLDVAISDALLRAVAAGRRPETVRIFRPGPAVAFGRLDALAPGFGEACAIAVCHGRTPVIRSVGGHAAPYDQRCLVVEHLVPAADVTAGLQERFADQSGRLRRALAELGADARIGELAGEYCAGAHSINVAGRMKIAGIAQRAMRGGALTSAVIVVGGGPELRALLAPLYAGLGIEVDPATAGALDEALPGITVAAVAERVRAAYGDARERELDPELLAAAAALAERHAAPA
jgi:lipoate-protein ligase A